MPSRSAVSKLKTTNISWCPSYRLVPTKYPPMDIFENIADPEDLEAILQIEAMTDDVARQMLGHVKLIPVQDRIVGKGAGRIMPCFLILDAKPSARRFNTCEFGAYYAGKELETAIKETIFHREKFLSETLLPPQEIDNVLILANIQGAMHDIRGMRSSYLDIYHDSDYTDSQTFASRLKAHGSYGIVYDSVRNPRGQCVAVLRPSSISMCQDSDFYTYTWDGTRITGYYKKSDFRSIE